LNATIKLYDEDAYRNSFEAEVLSCVPSARHAGAFDLVLDRTLFFPEEGGQTSDTGFLEAAETAEGDATGPAAVTDVAIDAAGVIVHTAARRFEQHTAVRGTIDWAHRYDNMRQHTGEHIFSGLVFRRFGLRNVGFRLASDVTTMDYSGILTAEQAAELETEANARIAADLPVDCRYPSPDELATLSYRSKIEITGPVRIVTIPDTDCCACCAPHVRRTGEVGLLKIIRQEKNKGGTRLTILCGSRALADYRQRQACTEAVSASLSVPCSGIAAAVERLKQDNAQLRFQLSEARTELMDNAVRAVPEEKRDVCLFTGALPEPVLRAAVNSLKAAHPGVCAVFSLLDDASSGCPRWHYILGTAQGDSRIPNRILAEKLHAHGGGSAEMVQGSAEAEEAEIRAVFDLDLAGTSARKEDL
jgi:alanyl-tRNA synthetase